MTDQVSNPDNTPADSEAHDVALIESAGVKDDSLAKEEEKVFAGTSAETPSFDEKNQTFEEKKRERDYEHLVSLYKEEILLAGERREYTKLLFGLTAGWLIIVILFVFISGLQFSHLNYAQCTNKCVYFKLSENVLIAFITSTTASVIGIFLIVAKWLFPSPKETPKEK